MVTYKSYQEQQAQSFIKENPNLVKKEALPEKINEAQFISKLSQEILIMNGLTKEPLFISSEFKNIVRQGSKFT
jgi:hypothetical protein